MSAIIPPQDTITITINNIGKNAPSIGVNLSRDLDFRFLVWVICQVLAQLAQTTMRQAMAAPVPVSSPTGNPSK